ncbi:hypothetical protein [Priestia megaterium]|uniref:hypothetical protein n=1 Tax=Priestia megaterium TaxID=1404 RepID=UPI00112E57FF|nr:hypothetical protein [Priestia megaterium]TPF18054.1 hypothetical protein CBE78_02165 [Priestia megaterium]TPF22161.1 hypothetical protein CBE79_04670 [Priestia megaterium]
MNKIKLPNEVALAMDILKSKIGKDAMYVFENILSHYKKSAKYTGEVQDSINIIVNFVKENKGNRISYYNALQFGYKRPVTPKEKVLKFYDDKAKEALMNSENIDLYIKSIGEMNAIKKTLNLLEIEVKGINIK